MGNDGKFAAISQAYFLALILSIAYYDVSVVKFNSITTIVVNIFAMIIFPSSYLLMNNLTIWIFILIVYIIAVMAAVLITKRTYSLFVSIESQEGEMSNLLDNVKSSFESLQESSKNINETLHSFNSISKEIALSTEKIANSVEIQKNEIEGSLSNVLNNSDK